jgi:hypothetical protein
MFTQMAARVLSTLIVASITVAYAASLTQLVVSI